MPGIALVNGVKVEGRNLELAEKGVHFFLFRGDCVFFISGGIVEEVFSISTYVLQIELLQTWLCFLVI